MKVLHVGKFYPPRWGGMETALKDICETTRDIAALSVAVANEGASTIEESLNEVPVRRLASWGTLFSQPLTPGLFAVLRRSGASIVHLHEPNPLATACFLASGSKARLVIHYHSDIVRQKLLARLYSPIQQAALARADVIFTGSQELVDSSPALAAWRTKCQVVPFGIDLRPFLSIDRAEPPSAAPLVLGVGRLSYYKGFQYLIQAMRVLPARLVIVGEGEMRPALESLIRNLDLGARVQLAGKVPLDELREWYRRASVFCLSSCESSEAFGLVQLEAMAAALPVVSTDLPTGVRAINVHGSTGLVVPPHDAAALSAAIDRLLADPGLRRRYGEAGRRRAREQFSREDMGRRIAAAYGRICETLPPTPAGKPIEVAR
jgi:rhamnosyl/mannosyltransferase